jgi:hypothetical protein
MADTVDTERLGETEEEESKLRPKIAQLAQMVRESKYTVFYTGAGVSTSSGIGDYRGPSGAWTQRRQKQLELKGKGRSAEENDELAKILEAQAAAKKIKQPVKKVSMLDAGPSLTHMAQATMIRLGLAHCKDRPDGRLNLLSPPVGNGAALAPTL